MNEDGWANSRLMQYMQDQEDYELRCEQAAEFVDELSHYDIIDELESRGFDCLSRLQELSGLDPDDFENDPHVMLEAALKNNDSNVSKLGEDLASLLVESEDF